jgi:toxin ParE1/3/4
VKLEWSRLAFADRDEIFDYLAADNPKAALKIDKIIKQELELLVDYPERGRPGRVEGTKELVITRTPYVVAYRIQAARIRILRILHGARAWPETFS